MENQLWPYLSPSRPGWWLVGGVRGRVRRVVSEGGGRRESAGDPLPVVLDVLGNVDRIRRTLDNDVLMLVAEAHQHGASWTEIANRLHRTKQTVHQQYQHRLYACRTRELLRRDHQEAVRQAQLLCRQGDPEEMVESRAFLRRLRTVGERPVPSPPADHR
ncbi:hypothetical protein [Streptomyces sp. URMC 125]|uniref:hypothetical protein n=1 Tax=Streptomyces sp. URMC 125 TaxID=3423419 RepID=UPI003F1D2676